MQRDRETTGDESLLAAWEELTAEAQARPWLLKLLAARGTALAARYALWKERLGRLRPGQRKRLQRRLGMSLAGAALLLALAASPGLGAPDAAITVDGTSCTLAEAITTANDGSVQTGCTTGDLAGPDTLTLTNNINLASALPAITSAITIEGGGFTIAGNDTFPILRVNSGASLTLKSATISDGSAAFSGGGIYNLGTLLVQDSTFSGNSAFNGGGGIGNGGGVVTVQNSTLSGNAVTFFGGGIYNTGRLLVQNSTISGNSAFIGGGIRNRFGTLTVQNSTLSANLAGSSGGGIENGSPGVVTVQNSTLSGNSASTSGGGIANKYMMSLQNSTLSGNSAGSGGGIHFAGGSFGYLGMRNSIVANSTGGDCVQISGGASPTYNLIEDSSNACFLTNGFLGNIIGQDPGLGTLTGGVHVPQSSSPAIDAGNPATPGGGGSACLSADQRGQARSDLRCDIGAVEVKLADTDTVTKNVAATGTFTFGPTLAKIVVTTQGTLSQLSVQHHSGDHANATQMNGQWWGITPTGSGFTANLDLPHTVSPGSNAKVCKHESGSDWDCDRTGSSATRVWRNGVTAFSDWAVGDNVTANAITLQDFRAASGVGGLAGMWAAALAGLGGLGLSAFFARRRSWRRPGSGPAPAAPSSAPQAEDATSPSSYTPPAISSRGQLKHFAGSPLAVDPLAPPDMHQ